MNLQRRVDSYERRTIESWADLRAQAIVMGRSTASYVVSGVALELLEHGYDPLLITLIQGEPVGNFSVNVLTRMEVSYVAAQSVYHKIDEDRGIGHFFSGLDFISL